MTTSIVLFALALYLVSYFTLGRALRDRLLRSREAPAAPSVRLSDGIDYVPTSKYVLFGHHFASIAGAGPITGPAMAVAWGWLPGLLWIWFGNVFLGAIHDYLALAASVRYDGRSVPFVAQDVLGKKAGRTFSWFILALCVLVVAAFGDIVAGQFAEDGRVFFSFVFFSFVFFCVVSTFALTTLDTTNRLGRYIVQETAQPLRETRPVVHRLFGNRWVASIVIAVLGIFLARSGGYNVLWPAFSGANQLLASIVMLTVAVWVKRKLDASYAPAFLVPAVVLWVTVTAALVWYEVVAVPTFFADPARTLTVVTGVVVGAINLLMLVLSFRMVGSFIASWRRPAAEEPGPGLAAEVREEPQPL